MKNGLLFGVNVRKPDLHKLIADYREISGEEIPVIVGSQAFHASLEFVPEIAKRSVECDFLLSSANFSKRKELDERLGALSDYQVANGFFADVLGLATVVLPDGWQERLVPFLDDEGTPVALCADAYDVCAAKLVAGREKDLIFIESALTGDMIEIDELLARIRGLKDKVENDVIGDRLRRLAKFLESKWIHTLSLTAIRQFDIA